MSNAAPPAAPAGFQGEPVPGWQPPAPKKKGKAGRIVLLVFLVLIVGGGISSALGNKSNSSGTVSSAAKAPAGSSGISTNSANSAHPPQGDIDAGWTCSHDELTMSATGTVTNHSSKTSTYIVSVSFIDKATGVRVDNGTAFVNEVLAGQTAKFDAVGFSQHNGALSCQITKVDRHGF